MQTLRAQRGMSIWMWLFVLAVLGYTVMMGVRLAPWYFEALSVKKIVEDVAQEYRGKDPSKRELWSTISKRLDINQIDGVNREHFKVVREGKQKLIVIEYDIQQHLVGNLDALMHFKFSAPLNGSQPG
jgi:hypothetical protein